MSSVLPCLIPPAEVVAPDRLGEPLLDDYLDFFASAPVFEAALPQVTADSRGSVVIIRLRGRVDLGTTFIEVLARYGAQLDAVGSRLVVVSVDDRVLSQLTTGGVIDLIGSDAVYGGDERLGAALARATTDARAWVTSRQVGGSDPP